MTGSTTGRLRLFAGFAFAPLAIPLIVAILISRSDGSAIGFSKPVILLATTAAYPSALLAAVLSYLLLRVMGWMRAWHFALAGLVTGAVEDVIWRHIPAHSPPWHLLPLPTLGAILGTLTALLFWLIAVAGTGGRGSVDRNAAAP